MVKAGKRADGSSDDKQSPPPMHTQNTRHRRSVLQPFGCKNLRIREYKVSGLIEAVPYSPEDKYYAIQ